MDADIRVMDAHSLDLPDGQFDAALLHLVLAVVPDPEAAIQEVARVLRPGGRVGVFDKFLADAAEPTLVRRAASVVTNVIATDITRRLGPLLDASGFVLERREPALFGGLFEVALARKPFPVATGTYV
jgi:SAM-dependent methyltransferase